MVPGILGVLSRWTTLAAALALLAAAWRLPSASAPGAHADAAPDDSEGGTVSWVLAGGAAAAVVLWLVASAWNRTVLPTEDIDTLTFHFPVVAKWIQNGSMWPVDQFVPLLAHGNYPHTGDVVFLAVIQPWRNDWLAGAVNPLYVALAGVAVYAIARELGAARPPAILAGALFASLPVVAGAANGGGLTDSVMYATFGAGLLFLLRHERGAPRSELWLAAIALGLAFGTKWYAVLAVPTVIAVWAGARLWRRAAARATLRDGAVLAGTIAAVGGFWLIRNWVESGNPAFPAELGLLGATIFEAPTDPLRACADFTVADYLTDGGAWWDHILPAYREAFLWPGAAIGAGLVAAVALAARGSRNNGVVAVGAVLVGVLAVGYALTPASAAGPEGEPVLVGANTRYLVPALLAAAPLAGWALARAGRARVPLELACVAAIGLGIGRAYDVPLHVVAAVLGALVAVSGAIWLALTSADRLRERARPPARAAVVVACLAGVAVVGHARQAEFNGSRYATGEATQAWIAHNASAGHRVALAGVWGVDVRSPVLPAFGKRLRNEVDYVGPTIDGLLREHSSRERWAAAIRRGGYDLLLVGRGGYNDECPLPGQYSDDDAWARAEGFRVVARDEHLTLYRVPG